MAKAATTEERGLILFVLVTTGVVLGGGALVWLPPSGALPAPPISRAPSTPQPVAAPARAPDRVEVPCEDAGAPAQPAPILAGPTFAVKARFLAHPEPKSPSDYFSRGVPVLLAADDGPATGADQQGTLRLPLAARRARFVAAGYRAVERDVPPPQAGFVDFGDVVFEPDAAVRVRLTGAPPDAAVLFALGRFPAVPYEQATATVDSGTAETVLPAPSQDDLIVSASAQPTVQGTPWFAVEPKHVRLESGETAMVELQASPGVEVTVAVHGLPALLAPHLHVALRLQDEGGRSSQVGSPSMRLDAVGRARFLVSPGRCQTQLWWSHGTPLDLRAMDGSGLVQTLAAGAVLDVEPIEPVLGVVVCERGQPVPSTVSRSGPVGGMKNSPAIASCHAITAAMLAATPRLWYWTEGQGSRAIDQEELHREGGLVRIDAERGSAEARLTVNVDIPQASRHALRIVAEPLQGGRPVQFSNLPFSQMLSAGDYRVRWICNGAPGPDIAAKLTLAPGEQRELIATVPVLHAWTACIVDRAVLGPQAGMCSALVDGQWAVGASMRDTPLLFQLPAAPRDDMSAEIYLHILKMRIPARVTSIDVGSQTFAIAHDLKASDVVHVHSRGLADGNRDLRLCSAIPETRFSNDLGPKADVPMLPGSQRSGCLHEIIDGRRQVTSWFTLQHGTPQVVIEPRGHWATVQLARQGVRATILIEGVAGMDAFRAGELVCPGDLRVFIADGTVAVHVDLQPGGRQTFAPELGVMVLR